MAVQTSDETKKYGANLDRLNIYLISNQVEIDNLLKIWYLTQKAGFNLDF